MNRQIIQSLIVRISFVVFAAMGALYSRLPAQYRTSEAGDSHTSLHKSFSISSQEFAMDHSTFPITVHQAEDGTMYNSILSKSNADELAKQGELIITVVSGQYRGGG